MIVLSPLKILHLGNEAGMPLKHQPMNPLHNKLLGLLLEPLCPWWPLLALHYFLEGAEHTEFRWRGCHGQCSNIGTGGNVTSLVIILGSCLLMEVWSMKVWECSTVALYFVYDDGFLMLNGINQLVFQWDAILYSFFSFTQKNSKICFILNCLLVIIYSTLPVLFFWY